MWSDDPDMPSGNRLPPGVIGSLRAARRPPALLALPVLGALLGAVVAACFTIIAAGLGEKTVFYCLFTVPFAMSVGLSWGGARADRMLGR